MIRPFEYEYLDDHTVVVYTTCPSCGHVNCTEVSREQLWELEFAAENPMKGKLIQNILPDHSPSDRECLVSGVCSTCWDSMFPKHGVEDEDDREEDEE